MLRRTALAVALVVCAAMRSYAADAITLTWDPNPPEEGVLGYRVHVGTVPGTPTEVYDVGNVTTFVYPGAIAGQEYFIAIVAYNAAGAGPYSELSAYSDAPPNLLNPGDQADALGQTVELQLNGGDIYGDPVSYAAGGLPPGLTLDVGTGLISGAATVAGLYSVTASISDGQFSAQQLFAWRIDDERPSVTITSPTSGPAYSSVDNAVAIEGTASDNVDIALITWTNDRGGAGFATGTSSWTIPSVQLALGDNVITVTVEDVAGQTAAAVITITNLNGAPVITNPGPAGSFQGFFGSHPIKAVDPDGDLLTFSAVNLPPGLAIDAATGVVSGIPTTVGVFTVVVSVSDGIVAAQASLSWSVTSPLPSRASPVGPSGLIATRTPAFSWNADDTAAYYALSVSDATGGSSALTWYTPSQAACPIGGTCTVAAPRSLAAGLVSWTVIAWNPFGYGPWSPTMTAVVDVADPAVPSPVLASPSGPIATRTPTYTWSPISNATWYQFSVTDALGVVREFWYTPSQACASSPCSVTPNVLLAIGPAQWKVRAWRASGAGAWTSLLAFDATDSTPGTATLVSPLSPVATVTPSFTWNAVLGTSYYLLRVTDRDNVTVDRWYLPAAVGCPLGAGVCTASPGIPLKAGSTTWRVLTWNGSGYGPWSAAREFLVEIADPAALAPAAVSPTGAIVTTNVPYRWTAVASAISYRLSIRNNGGAPSYWWYTPSAAGCMAGAECSAIPNISLANGVAQWQVQAWTNPGYGPWSPVIDLTVNIPAPPAPTLVSPSGATGGTPVFRWNVSATATQYYIRASDSTGLRIDKWLAPSQVGCASGGVCTFAAGVTFASGGGSWQVIAWNPAGYSRWSSTLVFAVP